MAPDSGVQVAGLFLETATRPFPLASFVSWPALKDKDKQRGLLEAQIITKYKKGPPRFESFRKTMFNQFLADYEIQFKTAIGVNENQALAIRDSSSSDK